MREYSKLDNNLIDNIEFEILCNNIKNDILEYMKGLIDHGYNVKQLSSLLIKSSTYTEVENKYKHLWKYKGLDFKTYFVKLAGDVINQIMFLSKIWN